jgi:hypothetical protein
VIDQSDGKDDSQESFNNPPNVGHAAKNVTRMNIKDVFYGNVSAKEIALGIEAESATKTK